MIRPQATDLVAAMPGRMILALVLSLTGMTALAAPASAARECVITGTNPDGSTAYTCTETIPGGGTEGSDDSGGSGGVTPTCDLTQGLYNEFCIGDAACFVNDPAAVQDLEENGLSEADRPSPESYPVYWQCRRPDGTDFDRYYWNDDQPVVTIEDRIEAAVGALDLPEVTASFNPPTRTLVNLPTWWWAEGAPPGEVRGSEALGMVAIAVPRGLSVDPGDGSGARSCAMSVQKSDACTSEYRRSGDYTATVAIVYDVSFQIDGQPIPIASVPAEFRTMTVDNDVDVLVREVQSRVTALG